MFEQGVELQNQLGVPSRMIDPAEARRLSPAVDTDGLLAAAFSPDDGHCTPEAVVQGYAAGGPPPRRAPADRLRGTGLRLRGDEVAAVVTDQGRVETGAVVCAAGAWSPAGRRDGRRRPAGDAPRAARWC